MNRLIFHNHDNVSIRNDNTGVIPLIPILIAVLIGGGMALVAWAFFAELWISTMIFIVIFLFIWLMITAVQKNIVGKRGLIVGSALIFVFVLLAIFVSPVMFAIVPFDADTETHEFELANHNHSEGNEHWVAHIELSGTLFITSWQQGQFSQQVTTSVAYILPKRAPDFGDPCAATSDFWYMVYINDAGSYREVESSEIDVISGPLGKENKEDPLPGGDVEVEYGVQFSIPSLTFHLKGEFIGGLRVEVWFDMRYRNCIVGNEVGHEDKMGSKDEANLRSGYTEITWEESRYQIGDTAVLELRLGYSTSRIGDGQGGYFLTVEAQAIHEIIFENFLPSDWEGTTKHMEFEVKGEYFDSEPPCADNSIKATISNTLFPQSEDWTAVTDFEALSPGDVQVTLSSPSDGDGYRTGETISITVTGEPNEQTQAPILDYFMYISPSDITENNSNGRFTFIPGHRGEFKLQFKCQDTFCRPSPVKTVKIMVYDPAERISDNGVSDIPWILIIVLLIWGIASAWIFYGKKVPGTKRTKVIVILAGFIVIALLFLLEVIPYG